MGDFNMCRAARGAMNTDAAKTGLKWGDDLIGNPVGAAFASALATGTTGVAAAQKAFGQGQKVGQQIAEGKLQSVIDNASKSIETMMRSGEERVKNDFRRITDFEKQLKDPNNTKWNIDSLKKQIKAAQQNIIQEKRITGALEVAADTMKPAIAATGNAVNGGSKLLSKGPVVAAGIVLTGLASYGVLAGGRNYANNCQE
jgi:hypothetical protein